MASNLFTSPTRWIVAVLHHKSAVWLLCLMLLITIIARPPTASAQPEEVIVSDLTPLDLQYMDRQRELVDELSRLNLGSSCCDSRADLPLLQRMLDDNVVRSDQRLELQAMGIVMGDILAAELDMQWVIYEDQYGRSRALRLGDTDNYLFPVTMISRRREAANMESVEFIYDKAYSSIEARLPPRPYE